MPVRMTLSQSVPRSLSVRRKYAAARVMRASRSSTGRILKSAESEGVSGAASEDASAR